MTRKDKTIYAPPDGLPTPEVGLWAEKKYNLIRVFTELFATGMKNKWEHRVYLDLFTGPGKVQIRDTRRILLGSPLLALDIPAKFSQYVFCDEDPGHIEALRRRVEIAHPGVVPTFILGNCNDEIDEVISNIPRQNALTFCLLDPFNLGIEFRTVQVLSHQPVDFLMSLMLGVDALRNSKRYIDENSTRIATFLGKNDWRTRWREEAERGKSFPAFLADEFVKQMVNLGYRQEALTTMVEVRSDEKNLWLYHIAFFSRHKRGYDFWAQGRKYALGQLELEFEGNQ